MDNFNVYKDIQARTNGEIYIGVVGPVRTGKSTFIKRFMDVMVLPNIEDVHSKERARDELPQSAAGKTIMTTEPKFIPKEAATIPLSEDTSVQIRLIDCVGYMVEGAAGHIENEQERLVKTPWFEHEIPFTEAAELGTRKVINEHATIGVVITTDGSFSELKRENYKVPEERTILELKKLGKPFIVLVNSNHPYSEETQNLAVEISKLHNVESMAINCEQLRKDDITKIMERVLSAFPVSEIDFFMPKWAEMLTLDHWLKQDVIKIVQDLMNEITYMRDIRKELLETESPYIRQLKIEQIEMQDGSIKIEIELEDSYYYKILSEMIGVEIAGEYELISILRELSGLKEQYEKVGAAFEEVRMKGYGVVTPSREEIVVQEPEITKQGSKYGVKIKASAPSIHMIKADIATEIAPLVGTEEQARDLIQYIKNNTSEDPDGIWETNIFGKSIQQLVDDGMKSKVDKLTEDSRLKLQEAIQKVINDSNGGLVCIII